MNVVGLDLSLTSTGFAAADGRTGTITTRLTGCPRLIEIRTHVLEIARGADVVVIEGYSFNSRNGGERIGELGGVIRVALYGNNIRFVEVAPAQLKKYATGRGNAKKAEVLGAAIRRLGYQGSSDDEADALWLRLMARDHYGDERVVPMPAAHREVLAKVEWPKLEVVA